MIGSIYAFFTGITGNAFFAGVIVVVMLGIFYIFAYYRLVITGWVFVPKDLSLFRQAKAMAEFTKLAIFPAIFQFCFAVVAVLVLLFLASKNVNVTVFMRLVLLGIAVIVGIILVFIKFECKLEPSNKTYRENGLLLGFYFNLAGKRERLPGYSRKLMEDICSEIKVERSPLCLMQRQICVNENKPNVIVIMNEAFADLNIFEGISLSKEPMENFKRMETIAKGEVRVPVIGGRTCNTEFEFLTGNAMEFIGMDVMPFEWEKQFVPTEDGRALPSLFRENGYKTVSIHPFMGAFFNRNTIHPKLGFDRCVFLEQMVEVSKKGNYVSDEYFTGQVLNIIAEERDQPLFLYGITMQNHYHYYEKKYERYDVMASGDFDNELLGRLNAYLQGVYDADVQLARTVAALRKTGRPTILLFFGDHKPLLGKTAFELYLKTGVVQSSDYTLWTKDQTELMFCAPYAVWSNYDLPKQSWGNITPYKLGALTAKLAGLDLNLYYDFLLQEQVDFRKKFQYIQHDKMYGAGYIEAALSEIRRLNHNI